MLSSSLWIRRVDRLLIGLLLVNAIKCATLVPSRLHSQNLDYVVSAGDPSRNLTKEQQHTMREDRSLSRAKAIQPCDLDELYFCSDVKDYPADAIESLVEHLKQGGAYIIGSDVMSHDYKQRSSFEFDEERLCETQERAIFPKKMKNLRDVERFIIQSKGLKQKILVEECSNIDDPCSPRIPIQVPFLFETYCKQVYSSKILLTYDAGTGQLIEDQFEFPSCCQCVIRPKGAETSGD